MLRVIDEPAKIFDGLNFLPNLVHTIPSLSTFQEVLVIKKNRKKNQKKKKMGKNIQETNNSF